MGDFDLKLDKISTGSTGTFGTIVGNNPLGDIINTDFINSCFTGKGNWREALGTQFANSGEQVLNQVVSGVGGAFSSSIGNLLNGTKLRIENEVTEAKIAKSNKKAEKAAEKTVAETKAIIDKATETANKLDEQISEALEILNEVQGELDKKTEELKKQAELVQTQIKTFNEKKAEKERKQAEYDKATGEDKEKLKKELNAINLELTSYAVTINNCKKEMTNISTEIATHAETAKVAQETASSTEEELIAAHSDSQEQANIVIEQGTKNTANELKNAASENVRLRSTNEQAKEQALLAQQTSSVISLIPGIGTAAGALGTASTAQVIAIATQGINNSFNNNGTISGIGQQFENNLSNIGQYTENFNTPANNVASNVAATYELAQAITDEANATLENPDFKIEEEEYTA